MHRFTEHCLVVAAKPRLVPLQDTFISHKLTRAMTLRTVVVVLACSGCALSVSPSSDGGRTDTPVVPNVDGGVCEPVTFVNSRLGFNPAATTSLVTATIVERTQTLLQLQRLDGSRTQFSWRGSDLPFQSGERVEIFRASQWDCVRSSMTTACVLSESGFTMPMRPSLNTPMMGHTARFVSMCSFRVTENSGCGTITQNAEAFSVEIQSSVSNTNVVVQPYNSGLVDGVVYTNLGAARWPSAMQMQGGQVCIVEARWGAVVTAVGPTR